MYNCLNSEFGCEMYTMLLTIRDNAISSKRNRKINFERKKRKFGFELMPEGIHKARSFNRLSETISTDRYQI